MLAGFMRQPWLAGFRVALATALLVPMAGIAVATAGTANAASRAGTMVTAGHSRAAATPKIRRKGILVLVGNGTAYDLDSRAPKWDPSIGVPWTFQNIEYFPHANGNIPALAIANEPLTDVLMGTKGHWTYQSCADARYDRSEAHNPNGVTGSALNVRHGICVITQNTVKPDGKPLKTDGGHYVLLVVKARTATTLTLEVTVWQ